MDRGIVGGDLLNRYYIIGASALLLLQSMLIAALLLHRSRRRRAERILRENQRRYALATAAGATGVWDWRLQTNDLYVDPQLKLILGFLLSLGLGMFVSYLMSLREKPEEELEAAKKPEPKLLPGHAA